jgi:lysophospholipase L1-like esterase
MKPISVVGFLIMVFTGLFVLMAVFPKGGIELRGEYKIQFPGLAEFFTPDTTQQKNIADILAITQQTEIAEKKTVKDEVTKNDFKGDVYLFAGLDPEKSAGLKIQYPKGDVSIMHRFFEKLANANGRKVRISHYGDSQIEGDRISGNLRNELQKKFGGQGPGLFPVIPIAPALWENNKYSDNWRRYTGFGRIDSLVPHKEYGALMSFSRFTPYSTSGSDTAWHSAWFEITPRFSSRAGNFKEFTMFYNKCSSPAHLQVYAGENLYREDSLNGQEFSHLSFTFDTPPPSIKLVFKGKSGPDILGFSITSETGVIVDNIPMRGASGTEFSKTDKIVLEKMLRQLSPDLLILQFGGNVLPYIDNEEKAANFGKWFENHVKMLRKMVPSAEVLVIGPADMSVKEGDKFVTHPFLENIRDAVREAAFSSGGAFWDMYVAMGGRNSMPLWVNADPPLGASDYIHFSPKGAAKIAEILNLALINDYQLWKNSSVHAASKNP